MNITIFNRFFPPQYSGAGRQISRLSKVFNENNIQVDVITTSFKKNKIVKSKKSMMNVHRLYNLNSQNIKKTELLAFSMMQCFWILKNIKYIKTTIFFSITEENLLPIILLKLLKKKVFIRTSLIGNDDIDTIMKQKLWFLYKLMIKKCDGVICITKKIKKLWEYRLLKLYRDDSPKTYFIPNGITISSLSKSTNSNTLKLRKKIINTKSLNKKIGITVGYFNSRKQIDKIIKEWSKLNEEWHLIVLGKYDEDSLTDLNYMNKIKSYIEKYNLEDRITLDYSKNVRDYLLASDFFIFASKSEGLPNALLEAMSCGLPSLILKQEWVPEELIEHNNTGLIVDSIDDFSKVLKKLSSDKKRIKNLGNMAMKKIQNKYDINLVGKKYINLFKNDR